MLVDAGRRSAKGAARIALPFRLQGNDATEWAGGDGRGNVLRQVTGEEGCAERDCPRLWSRTESKPPHPALRATFSPAGRRNHAGPATYPIEGRASGSHLPACSSPRRGEVPERSEAMRGQGCR
ncbi:hypothetical protein FLX27_06690 [Agrobacterium tumefaciens]|nr:hypothetical protein FLX27_06690 [Agrobacterium tumefaciens]